MFSKMRGMMLKKEKGGDSRMRRRKVAAETLMYDIDSICAGKNMEM
jgi:hypothetical protein